MIEKKKQSQWKFQQKLHQKSPVRPYVCDLMMTFHSFLTEVQIVYWTQELTLHFFASEGTMSGGGNKVVKGRMGSSILSDVNPDQLEAMEKTLEKETKTAEVHVTTTP